MTLTEILKSLHGIYEFLTSTLFILTICVVSGLLKLQIIREYFDLDFFFRYQNWINICFFISTIYLILKLFQAIYKKSKFLLFSYIDKRNTLKELDSLNEEEKKILEWLVSNNAKTISGRLADSSFSSLVMKGILIRADCGFYQQEWAHTIESFVWKKIKSDPRFKK